MLERFRSRGPVTVRRERKGKLREFDLDRELLDLRKLDDEALSFTLALGGGGASVRPEEVLAELFGQEVTTTVVREDLLVDRDGKLIDPIQAATEAADDAQRAVC